MRINTFWNALPNKDTYGIFDASDILMMERCYIHSKGRYLVDVLNVI